MSEGLEGPQRTSGGAAPGSPRAAPNVRRDGLGSPRAAHRSQTLPHHQWRRLLRRASSATQNHRSPAPKPEVRAEPNDILKVVQKQFDAKIVGVVTEGRKHWGEFVCPIGARKGQKLSEIPAKAVEWWYQNFEVNPKYPDSKEFRNALDDWKAEHELNKSKIKNDRIPVDETGRGAPDDDGNPVPF